MGHTQQAPARSAVVPESKMDHNNSQKWGGSNKNDGIMGICWGYKRGSKVLKRISHRKSDQPMSFSMTTAAAAAVTTTTTTTPQQQQSQSQSGQPRPQKQVGRRFAEDRNVKWVCSMLHPKTWVPKSRGKPQIHAASWPRTVTAKAPNQESQVCLAGKLILSHSIDGFPYTFILIIVSYLAKNKIHQPEKLPICRGNRE